MSIDSVRNDHDSAVDKMLLVATRRMTEHISGGMASRKAAIGRVSQEKFQHLLGGVIWRMGMLMQSSCGIEGGCSIDERPFCSIKRIRLTSIPQSLQDSAHRREVCVRVEWTRGYGCFHHRTVGASVPDQWQARVHGRSQPRPRYSVPNVPNGSR